MSDKYFDKKVDEWVEAIKISILEGYIRRELKLFAKDIELDTRNKATELANQLLNDIHNMRHDDD